MSDADATPTRLLFTTADYDVVTNTLPRIARLGGRAEISNDTARDGQPQTLWITAPGSPDRTIDWAAWREADGIHAERLADGALYLADDMADLHGTLMAEWEAAAAAREAKARRAGLDSLPEWLRREE